MAGLRVLEFSQAVAAPLVGEVLATHGAQVILVENEAYARGGTHSREPGAGSSDQGSVNQGTQFNKFNVSKLSLTLDLSRPQAVAIVRRLARSTDVVVSNYRPGVLERWGLGYRDLVKIKPDIITVAMSAMGNSGPRRHYVCMSWNTQAMGGYNLLTGFPGRAPITASDVSLPDTSSAPFHALTALLSALHYRQRTGRGQQIELSQYEGVVCFTETAILDALVHGRNQPRRGNSLPYAVPHGVYRCQGQDRWCALAVFTDAEWEALCRTIGQPALAADSRFATFRARRGHREELDRLIEAWTSQRPPDEVAALLQATGVCAGAVQTVEHLRRHDVQLKARGHWVMLPHPETGEVSAERWGFSFDGSDGLALHHAPLLGEHNDFVLKEVLGMAEEEINQLIVEGVVS